MPEADDPKANQDPSKAITRRRFILGVIAGGAVVSAASYRILAPGRERSFGGERLITLNVNGQARRVVRTPAYRGSLPCRSFHRGYHGLTASSREGVGIFRCRVIRRFI